MKRYSVFSKLGLTALVVLFAAKDAMAQGLLLPRQPTGLPGAPTDTITDVIIGIVNIALAIVGILAVAYLIYGGFRYITSGGGDEGTKEAKEIIRNAIIGLIVVILSYVVIVVIINALAFFSA